MLGKLKSKSLLVCLSDLNKFKIGGVAEVRYDFLQVGSLTLSKNSKVLEIV